MGIPSYETFMVPALRFFADGREHPRKTYIVDIVKTMGLTTEELEETLQGGRNRARSRAEWAVEHLAQAGALERPSRGMAAITDIGIKLLADHPQGLSWKDLLHLPGFQDWTRRSREAQKERNARKEPTGEDNSGSDTGGSPLENLIESIDELNAATAHSLVVRLREQEPVFLERAVIKLLYAMGYGGSENDGEHLGKSHDGGVDGVIRQDALGLERVYIQAKRYKAENTVGSAAIREFVGALTGVSASGGVFITTSSFSADAKEFAARVNARVILIDGQQLGQYMIEYGVGVTTTQTLRVSEVDENFFDDE